MGSKKGLEKRLNDRALFLRIRKGSNPMNSDQIREAFEQARKNRKNNIEEEPPIPES